MSLATSTNTGEFPVERRQYSTHMTGVASYISRRFGRSSHRMQTMDWHRPVETSSCAMFLIIPGTELHGRSVQLFGATELRSPTVKKRAGQTAYYADDNVDVYSHSRNSTNKCVLRDCLSGPNQRTM